MPQSPVQVGPAESTSLPEQSWAFQCAEVQGGNRAVEMPIRLPGIVGQLSSQPCQSGVGGDIHYLSTCGSGLTSRFCIADVVGHGEEVKVVSTSIHALLRRFLNAVDHRRALKALNERLTEQGLESLTTAAVFTYFPPRRSLSFSYAGHPPAWLYRSATEQCHQLRLDDESDADDDTNFPLAVSRRTRFTRRAVKVRGGDTLVVVSDGVTDALNREQQAFGISRVHSVIEREGMGAPRHIISALQDELHAFTGDASFKHDDVTILALRFEQMSFLDCIRHVVRNRIGRPLQRARARLTSR